MGVIKRCETQIKYWFNFKTTHFHNEMLTFNHSDETVVGQFYRYCSHVH